MYDFTITELMDKVREVAAERPAYIYPMPSGGEVCKYLHDDAPGCIFGHALNQLGVPVEVLHKMDVNETSIEGALVEWGLVPDRGTDESRWCAAVQAAQDGGIPWSEAVAIGDWMDEE